MQAKSYRGLIPKSVDLAIFVGLKVTEAANGQIAVEIEEAHESGRISPIDLSPAPSTANTRSIQRR